MRKSIKQLVDVRTKRVNDELSRKRSELMFLPKEQGLAIIGKIESEAHEALYKSIADTLIEATEKKDPTILHELFGAAAHTEYCSTAALKELEESIKNDVINSYALYLYKGTLSVFLEFGFHYACFKGALPLIRYYVEQQPFAEDMGNLNVNLRGIEKHFPNTPVLNGSVLKLATISNEISCVEYLYENTEAMVETECEDISDRRSCLQIATMNKNAALVKFLLAHSADPNGLIGDSGNIMESLATFGRHLFDVALGTRDIEIITAYLEAGAIVNRSTIRLAIGASLPLPILQLLFAHCINKEDLSNPYLLSAVATGDIEYLKLIESLPNVSSWQMIFDYHESQLHERLVHIATSSGSLAMLQHIAEQHHIDVKAIAVKDNAAFEARIESGHLNGDPIRVSGKVCDTLMHKATRNIALLQFYFETLDLSLSEKALILQVKACYNICTISYFLSMLDADVAKKAEFKKIAVEFDSLSMHFLFRLFNTRLVLEGNPYGDLYGNLRENNFIREIAKSIQKAIKDKDIATLYREIKEDAAALKGALFYFCTSLFEKDADTSKEFFSRAFFDNVAVDETNCLGTTLAHFADTQRNEAIVAYLTLRGANPDKPNHKGETLLASRSHFYSFQGEKINKETIAYIEKHMLDQQVGHSLLYKLNQKYSTAEDITLLLAASKGDIKPVSIDAVIKAVLTSRDNRWDREKYFTLLFIHLAETHAIRLVQRLREPKLIESVKAEPLVEEFKYYLQQFEKTDKLSAQEKSRRLVVLQANPAPHVTLFASAAVVESGSLQNAMEDLVIVKERALNNSMD